jgi:hypothetical protein
MAASDTTFTIFLKTIADATGLTQIGKSLEELSKSTISLGDAFKFAGAEEALRRVIDAVEEIPRVIEEGIKSGVEFNAELQHIQLGFAAILQETQAGKFVDFSAAKSAAGDYIEVLKQKANELGIAYHDMFEGFQHTQAQLSSAGVTDISKAIELTVILNQAMQAVGTSATQAARDIGDILTGQAARTIGGARLAAALGMTKEDFDLFILQAIQTGTLYDQLKSKLSGFAKSAFEEFPSIFEASMNRMKNAILDLESTAAGPIMQPLQQGIEQFTATLRTDQAQAWARSLGAAIVDITRDLIEGTKTAYQFGAALAALVPGGGLALKIGGLLGDAAHASQSAQLEQIHIEQLQKETRELQQQIQASNSLETVQSAQQALASKIIQLRQEITAETLKGKDADQGVLSTLQNVLNQLISIAEKFFEIQGAALGTANAVRAITPALQKVLDQQDLFRQMTYGSDADVYRAKWTATYHAIAEEAKKAGQPLADYQLQQLTYERLKGPERQKEIAALEKESGVQKDVTDFTREQALLLTEIHNRQQIINANPFLTIDQKQKLAAESITQEIATLNTEIQRGQALMKGGTLDPAQYSRIAQEVDNLRTKVKLLTFEQQKLTFGGGLKASLIEWANSFGTAAQQIARALTSTIGTAIQGVSSALTGLIFHTKNWGQAFLQAGQSIVQSLIQIGLQMLAQKLLSSLLTGQTIGEQAAAGPAVATAWGPAAAATSIGSFGSAATVGMTLALAAISAITGALGAQAGGFTGEGGDDEVGGFFHRNEFIFSAPRVRAIGRNLLEAMHRGTLSLAQPNYRGDYAGPGGGGIPISPSGAGHDVHVAIFDDRSALAKWFEGRHGQKIIFNSVNRQRINLGLR